MAEAKTAAAEVKTTKLYDIKNNGSGLRVFYDANNRAVSIDSGAGRERVELNDNIVRRLRQTSKSLELRLSGNK